MVFLRQHVFCIVGWLLMISGCSRGTIQTMPQPNDAGQLITQQQARIALISLLKEIVNKEDERLLPLLQALDAASVDVDLSQFEAPGCHLRLIRKGQGFSIKAREGLFWVTYNGDFQRRMDGVWEAVTRGRVRGHDPIEPRVRDAPAH